MASTCCTARLVDRLSVAGALMGLRGLIFLLGAAVVLELLDLRDF